MISAWIPGPPMAQPRARAAVAGKYVRLYDPASAKSEKARVQHFVLEAMREMQADIARACPLRLTIVCMFERPQSHSKKQREQSAGFKISKPDADNLAKLYMDALNGVAWADDAMVAELTVQKQYADYGGSGPGTLITIERL